MTFLGIKKKTQMKMKQTRLIWTSKSDKRPKTLSCSKECLKLRSKKD